MTDAQRNAVAQAPADADGIGRRELKIILAGFGGQGILFAGKLIAYAGLEDGRELSWLPSYGPEMRGGTASCNVTLSDDPIGSPLIQDPNVLVAMNQPSLDKFASEVEPGGVIVVNTTLAPDLSAAEARRADGVEVYALPATQMAEDAGLAGLANIICAGKLWSVTHFCTPDALQAGLAHCVPPRKAHLLEPNKRALQLGAQA